MISDVADRTTDELTLELLDTFLLTNSEISIGSRITEFLNTLDST